MDKIGDIKKGVPALRGKIHIPVLVFYSLLAFLVLKVRFNLSIKLSYYVFLLCCLFNFIPTIVLHNFYWTNTSRAILRRIDYAGIFLMIGGTGFPTYIHYMNNDSTVWVGIIHWFIIFFGVFGSLLFNFTCTSKWFRSTIYVLSSLPYFFLIYKMVISKYYYSILFVFFTALFYVMGSVFYTIQYPNLIPGIFESHELFHLFCSLGFLSSSAMNYQFSKYNKI